MKLRVATLAQWSVLGSAVGVLCGAASALFLHSLDRVTAARTSEPRLVLALPIAGLLIGFVYERFGEPIRGGNNLIIDTIHDDGDELPLRMAPMVLAGTLLTHLFGGSAGREGTAVQIGASLSDHLAHRLRVPREVRRGLLAAGVAGGFGSVFGTPIAGAIFGLEFVVLGQVRYTALLPAVIASVVGDLVTRSLGIVHTPYPSAPALTLDLLTIGKWIVFAAAIAMTTTVFVELTHGIKKLSEKRIPSAALRAFTGGLAVVALRYAVRSDDSLGLSIPLAMRAFVDPHLPATAFALKLVFTSLTLGAGFLGGEVTPLFVVGATLGNVLARVLDLPIELGAAVGLAATFGTAANTPIALSIMAVELVGANAMPHVVLVCVVAYLLSGHRGIYPSQRLRESKTGSALATTTSIRDLGAPPPPPSSGPP